MKLYHCRLKTTSINYRHLYIKENKTLICYIHITNVYMYLETCMFATCKVNFHSETKGDLINSGENLGQILIFWQRNVFLCRESSVNYSYDRWARCYSLYLDLDRELSWSHMGWHINAILPEACAEEYEKQKKDN